MEVKDFFSFVAVRKVKVGSVLQLIKNEKIKNKKVKMEVAKQCALYLINSNTSAFFKHNNRIMMQ